MPKGYGIPESTQDAIVWLFDNGTSQRAISEGLGVSYSAVVFYCGMTETERSEMVAEEITPLSEPIDHAHRKAPAHHRHARVRYWVGRGVKNADIARRMGYRHVTVRKCADRARVTQQRACRLTAVARRKFQLGDDDAPLQDS